MVFPVFSSIQTRENITRWLILAYLFFLSTSFNFLNFGGRNILFIIVACLVISLLVFIWPTFFQWKRSSIFMLLVYMPISFLINYQNASLISLLYSVFFVVSFVIVISFGTTCLTKNDIYFIIKRLLIAYFLVTVCAQLYVAFGLFKMDSGSIQGHGLFGTVFTSESNSIRFYSLSSEPSYASTIIVFFYYLFTRISIQLEIKKKSGYIFFFVLYMVISFTSGFGFLLFAIFLWLNLKGKSPTIAIASVVLLSVLFTILLFTDLNLFALVRIRNIIKMFDFSDWTSLKSIDYSASFRVLPFYYYLKSVNLFDLNFYLGHGAAVSDKILNVFLFPHIHDDSFSFQGGFLPGFLIDYGLIGFLLIFYAFIKETKSMFSFGAISMLFVLVNANFNTQLFWIVFTFLTLENKVNKNEDTN